MIRVVLDCNVVLAAIGWRGTARQCLKLAAERRIRLCLTNAVLAEYEAVIPERLKRKTQKWIRIRNWPGSSTHHSTLNRHRWENSGAVIRRTSLILHARSRPKLRTS